MRAISRYAAKAGIGQTRIFALCWHLSFGSDEDQKGTELKAPAAPATVSNVAVFYLLGS